MHLTSPSPGQGPKARLRRASFPRGFTLVETMVATVLLSMMILGILQVLIGSYRLGAKARYNDHARYIIKSFADQFLTQQSTYITGATIQFFVPTSATGVGLSWTATAPGGTTQSTTVGTASGLLVPLSDSATGEAPIVANVTRTVWCLDPSTGLPETPATTVAGALLRGDFTVTFPFGGKVISETISAVRSTP